MKKTQKRCGWPENLRLIWGTMWVFHFRSFALSLFRLLSDLPCSSGWRIGSWRVVGSND